MRKWLPLVAVCAGTFMLPIDVTIVTVALPSMARGLHRPPHPMTQTAATAAPAQPRSHRDPTPAVRGTARWLRGLAFAEGHGRPWHVRHHRPDRAARAARDPSVVQPGLPAGGRAPGAAEPEGADGAAGHPGLLGGRLDRAVHASRPGGHAEEESGRLGGQRR